MAAVKVCSFARQLHSSTKNVQILQVTAFSTTSRKNEARSYKMLIVGGGSGGSAIANKFSSKFGKDLCVLEPSEVKSNKPSIVFDADKVYVDQWRIFTYM